MPQDDAASEQGDRYLQAWDAIGKLLDAGRSWSGRERNVSFLNTADGRFASFSGLAGLDQDSDSRGVAVVDWDRDGALDLWVSNRDGSRVRFLRNTFAAENEFVSLSLEGKTVNRDAIGARVELLFEGDKRRSLSRTLRAGEGYLTQTSKWLHFPVLGNQTLEEIRVFWPGKPMERFSGLKPGARMRLVEGAGKAEVLTDPPRPRFPDVEFTEPERSDRARVIPHGRLPLPTLDFINLEEESVRVDEVNPSGHTLVVLWASWCAPCLVELRELNAELARLTELKVKVVPLNVENLDAPASDRIQNIRRFMAKNRLAFTGGLATPELVEVLDVVQRSIVGRQDSLPIPSSFLLDSDGSLVSVYKGRFEFEQLLSDAKAASSGVEHDRDFALPFGGRWYVAPFGIDRFGLIRKLLELDNKEAAYSYLKRHLGVSLARNDSARAGGLMGEKDLAARDRVIAGFYRRTGSLLARARKYGTAAEAFQSGLVFLPDSSEIRADLAVALQADGNFRDALKHFRQLREEQPDQIAILNSLAWILATASDADLLQPREAIELAERACELSEYQLAETMDTLAAAHAAAGDYPRAVETAQRGIALAVASGGESVAKQIRQRLSLYQTGQPFRSQTRADGEE